MIKSFIRRALACAGYELRRLPAAVADDSERLLALAGRDFLGLHFGCGPRVIAGWANLDLHYEPADEYLKYYGDAFYPPDIRGGLRDFFVHDVKKAPLPLPDCSVDVVFHEDFIEHLDQQAQVLFLAENLRVLKPGGVHRVNTPDFTASMRSRSDFSKGFAGVYRQEWERHGHLNVLSREGLRELAGMVGYSRVVFTERDGCSDSRVPREYRPSESDPDRVNIFADLIK